MITMHKNNQQKQVFLGTLACVLGSQYDEHLDAKFNFKLQKKNYFKQAQDLLNNTCENEAFLS